MRQHLLRIALPLALAAVPTWGAAQSATQAPVRRRAQHAATSLTAFGSDQALAAYIDSIAAREAVYDAAMRKAALAAQAARAAADSAARCTFHGAVPAAQITSVTTTGPSAAVVRVSMTNDKGAPIAGGTIMVCPASTIGGTTNEQGEGTVIIPASRLTSDSIRVVVRRIGYSSAAAQLPIKAGQSVAIHVALTSQPLMLSETVVTGAAIAEPAPAPVALRAQSSIGNITNVQHQGVDEGDIVKLVGRYLVVLRRGRLFTIDLGDGTRGSRRITPRTALNAFGPEVDPRGTWYDELLVSGDRVVVVGYSYQRGGTEIGLFHLSDAGALRYEGTYQLRSYDYYSSRNYASRLIGHTLVFYAPLPLARRSADLAQALPALRAWRPGATPADFRPIATTRHIYRPPTDSVMLDRPTMHAITTCDVAAPTFRCDSRVVLGGPGNVFYVSPSAVYLWTSPSWATSDTAWARASRSLVYRIPLDSGAPQAIRASGSPADQLALLERDGHLNVLVRGLAGGNWMWRGEHVSGGAALLRLPISAFGDGTQAVPRSRYRALPVDTAAGAAFQERFVGDWLLYGVGNGWWRASTHTATLYGVRIAGGDVARLSLAHGIDRIDALGRDAVVVGSDGENLHFDGIDLARDPTLAEHYVLPHAAQGELRTHGFFYRDDGDGSGLLGLPVRATGNPGWTHLVQGSASVLFLRNAHRQFVEAGALSAHAGIPSSVQADACQASCVDWYGNARPLFIGDRVFALLGYELVEGRLEDGQLVEQQRIDFAPHAESSQ